MTGSETLTRNLIINGVAKINFSFLDADDSKQYTATTSFIITSNNQSNYFWNFTIPNSYGRAFRNSIFTDTSPTPNTKPASSNPFTSGTLGGNGSFQFVSRNTIYQPYSESLSVIDYCGDFKIFILLLLMVVDI
jgi:hypothetical protein